MIKYNGKDVNYEEKKQYNAYNNYGYNWEVNEIQFVNSYHPSYSRFEDDGRLKEALDIAFN